MNERKRNPRTATEEVLHEFEEAELRIGEGRRDDENDKEAADTLTPSQTAQESVQNDKHRRNDDTP
ncbi:hypothetical protein QWM81_04395 [Streptomyces ficellus]|uniref:YfhD family protein n=1 Tax=Streptomyces ficellus TaxID=1977088 RepID=A0ABT7Z1E5_9ACTN|nr:hypothetical protein [Streptomyces ficellus]MDN3293300.1 hypothetical protein [Streptomyces ficellus]